MRLQTVLVSSTLIESTISVLSRNLMIGIAWCSTIKTACCWAWHHPRQAGHSATCLRWRKGRKRWRGNGERLQLTAFVCAEGEVCHSLVVPVGGGRTGSQVHKLREPTCIPIRHRERESSIWIVSFKVALMTTCAAAPPSAILLHHWPCSHHGRVGMVVRSYNNHFIYNHLCRIRR